MEWILEVGRERKVVDGRDALAVQMASLCSRASWVARLVQRTGEMKGWQAGLYRILGLTTEEDGNSVLVRSTGGLAAVSLLDQDLNETIVMEPGPVENADQQIKFDLGRGETEIRPRRQCISVDEAVAVVLHFFEHGHGPKSFRYESMTTGRSSRHASRQAESTPGTRGQLS
jgi:hypothetical protein